MVDLTILMILLTKTTKVKKKIGSGGDNSLKHHRTDLKGSIHMPAGTRNPEKWVSTKAALALRPFTELWILCSPVLNAWCAEDRSYIPGPAQSECLIGACMCAYPVISDSFVTPWSAARQAPLSMGFSRQEYWSELPFPPSGDLPDPGIKSGSPALAGRFFTTEPPRKHPVLISLNFNIL